MSTVEEVVFRQERTVSEIINVTFTFVRQNFLKLMKCIIFIAGPFMLIGAYLLAQWYRGLFNMPADPDNLNGLAMMGDYLLSVLGMAISFTLLADVICKYIRLYLDETVSEFDVGDVLRGVLEDLGKVFLISIILVVAIYAGFILCIFPGMYVAVAFSLALIAVTIEKTGPIAAISRSRDLISGYWWNTFGMFLLITIIESVLATVFYMPFYVILFVFALNSPDPEAISSGAQNMLVYVGVLAMFGAFLLQCLPVIATAFQYFNLVERKEGKGLLDQVEQIGSN